MFNKGFAGINWAHPLNRNLVSWWLVNPYGHPSYKGGNTLRDLCGRNNGTLNNSPTWQGSRNRVGGQGSLSFNASLTQSVSVPTIAAASATISCWVRYNDAGTNYMFINKQPVNTEFNLFLQGGLLNVRGGSSVAAPYTAPPAFIWHHLCGTIGTGAGGGGGSAQLLLYINGLAVAGEGGGDQPTNGSGTIDIGRYGDGVGGYGYYLDGEMDDIRIYSRVLSAAEVYQLYILSKQNYQGLLNKYRQKIVYSIPTPIPTTGLLLPQTKLNAGSPVNKYNPLNRNLVNWWLVSPLNHPSYKGGSRLLDLCGRNHGTLINGVTWQGSSGRQGGRGSLLFDGVDDYVEMPLVNSGESYKPTGAMTISGWFLGRGAVGGSPNDLIIAGFGTMDEVGQRGYWLASSGSAGTYFHIASDAVTIIGTDDSGSPGHNSTVWTHYTGVYVPSVSLTLYRNGLQIAQNTSSIPATQYQGNGIPLRIGARLSNSTYWVGNQDNIQVYSRALSSTEVWNLYNLSRQNYQGLLNTYKTPIVNFSSNYIVNRSLVFNKQAIIQASFF